MVTVANAEKERQYGPIDHRDTHRRRSALVMTVTELRLIAALAIIGLSSRPANGYSTPAAIGTASALKTKAKNKFCRMLRIVAWLRRRARRIPWRSPLTRVIAALS